MNRTRVISFDADFSSFNRRTDEAASRADKALNRANTGTAGGGEEELRGRASEIFKEMANDAERITQSQTERNRMIREEISLLQQSNRLEEQRARAQARARLDEAVDKQRRGQITKAELEKEKNIYSSSVAETRSDANSNRTLTSILRNYSTHYSSRSLDDPQEKEEYDLEKEGDVDRKKKREKGGGDSGASAFGYAMAGGAASAFGLAAFMSIQSFISKIIHDAEKLDISRGQFMGLKGQEGSSRISGMGEAAGFGLSNADFYGYSKGVGKSLGRANFGDSAINQLAIEKRFGLDDGSLNSLNEVGRMGSYTSRGRGSSQDSSSMAETLVRELKSSNVYGFKQGDFSMLGEKLDDLGSVMENVGENIEGGLGASGASNLISAFSRVGGSFSDQRQVQSIGQIDKSIRNPNSEFSQAMMFRAIRAQDPNMSLFDVMKQQEQGATPQNITAIMDVLGKGGNNENTYFNVSQALGLRLGQAENLTKSYLDPKGEFKDDLNSYDLGSGGEDDFVRSSRRLGKRAPGTIQQFNARIENLSASKGSQAMQALQPVMEEAFGVIDTAGDILVMAFKGVSALVDTIQSRDSKIEDKIKKNNPENVNPDGSLKTIGKSVGGAYNIIQTEDLIEIKNLLMDGIKTMKTSSLKESYWNK